MPQLPSPQPPCLAMAAVTGEIGASASSGANNSSSLSNSLAKGTLVGGFIMLVANASQPALESCVPPQAASTVYKLDCFVCEPVAFNYCNDAVILGSGQRLSSQTNCLADTINYHASDHGCDPATIRKIT